VFLLIGSLIQHILGNSDHYYRLDCKFFVEILASATHYKPPFYPPSTRKLPILGNKIPKYNTLISLDTENTICRCYVTTSREQVLRKSKVGTEKILFCIRRTLVGPSFRSLPLMSLFACVPFLLFRFSLLPSPCFPRFCETHNAPPGVFQLCIWRW